MALPLDGLRLGIVAAHRTTVNEMAPAAPRRPATFRALPGGAGGQST